MQDSFEALIESALASLPPLSPRGVSSSQPVARRRALDAALLAAAAERRGLRVQQVTDQLQLISSGRDTVGFYQNMPWSLTALDRAASNDKQLTKQLLEAAGLPVAQGMVVEHLDDAIAAFQKIDGPVVVKPIMGSGGKGITVDVRTEDELVGAYSAAASHARRVLVEESIPSIDLRIMVVGRDAVAAMMRVPAHVTGDGISTISELVRAKNEVREKNPYLRHSPIKLDAFALRRLSERGLDAESVLGDSERVLLHYKANLSSGGDSIDVTDLIHSEFLRIAERAATCFTSAGHAGVDILTQRIDASPAEQKTVVCEVNLNNDMPMHEYPLFGDPVPCSDFEIASYLDHPNAKRVTSRLASLRARPRVAQFARLGVGKTPMPDGTTAIELLATEARDYGDARKFSVARNIDREKLREDLHARGFRDLRFEGRLIYARDGAVERVMHRSGRSVFSGKLINDRRALEALLTDSQIDIARRATLARSDLDRSTSLLSQLPGPWSIRTPANVRRSVGSFQISSVKGAERAIRRVASFSSRIVVEQSTGGHAWKILMLEGRPSAALALVRPAVVGDGVSTLGALVAQRAALRNSNPYLRLYGHRQWQVSESRFARLGLEPTSVPAAGDVIEVGKSTIIRHGAETLGHAGQLDAELVSLSRRVHRLLGSPPLLTLTFGPRDQGEFSRWSLIEADADPLLAEFHWPSGGALQAVYPQVAEFLAGSQSYVVSTRR